MTRIRGEARSLRLRDAVSRALNLAVGLALGILMDTFLVHILLVPSTVLLLGRWNWVALPDEPHHWRRPRNRPREPETAEVS